MSIPHLFRCPISLDLFTDPVTLSTGQTYDRPSIEKWLAGGNLTCPVTMQRLIDTSLVPNHTLRHLIDQWLLSGPDQNPRHKPAKHAAGGGGTGSALARLKQMLESPDAAVATKLETLRRVRILSMESDIGQACLVQLGFFPLMLHLLLQTTPQLDDNPELAELALDCLLSLSPSTHLDSLNDLLDDSSLASLVLLLDQGNVKIKTGLCHLLETMATSVVTEHLCLILGQSRLVLQVLVSLVSSRDAGGRASEAAVRAMSGLCSLEANRHSAVREGAIDCIVSYLTNSNLKNAMRALATLELLVGLEAGRKAVAENPSAVFVLVKWVFRVRPPPDHRGSEHAVGALLIVCCESSRARMEAVSAGVFTQLLLLLQSQCSSKAKAKARALLKLLRSMWVRDPGEGKFYHAL